MKRKIPPEIQEFLDWTNYNSPADDDDLDADLYLETVLKLREAKEKLKARKKKRIWSEETWELEKDDEDYLFGIYEEPDCYRKPISGEIVKVELDTCMIVYGPEPEPDDETEQVLTLTGDRLVLKRYLYGRIGNCRIYSLAKRQIPRETVDAVIGEIRSFFENYPEDLEMCTDCGDWTLRLYNSANEVFCFNGTPSDKRLGRLSRNIRSELGIKELFLFDGKNK